MNQARPFVITLIVISILSMGCGLAQPLIERLPEDALAALEESTPTPTRIRPTPRPTFTMTPTPTDTATHTPTFTPTPTFTHTPTETPTPADTPTPTETYTPAPTDTPPPTNTPVPRPTRPPTETPTPAPPTVTPTPDWEFKLKEQADRTWQKTSNNQISNIALISNASDTPLGGYYVVGEHTSGKTYKSPASSWQYDAVNGLEGYVKQGNLKVELGPYMDGIWYVYVVDGGGTQLSAKVPLEYSSDPSTWVWDFLWWSQ